MSHKLGKIRNIITVIIATLVTLFATSAFITPAEAYVPTGATLSIPSIELNAPIVTIGIRAFDNGDVTWDTSQIESEVGFLDGMSWFGQGGNTVLGGHSELADRVPAVFYELDRVTIGDEIIVTTNGIEIRYQVTDTYTVNQSDLSILYPTGGEQLTLFTCDIESYNNGSYNRRDVVIATRIN